MLLFGMIKLGSVYFPDANANAGGAEGVIMTVIIIVMVIGMFVMPFALIATYAGRFDKLKFIHPAIRYLLLLPVMFLAASYMNLHSSKLESLKLYGTSGDYAFFLAGSLYIFVLCVVAPRLFATGEQLSWKGWLWWLARYILFFCGLYFDF